MTAKLGKAGGDTPDQGGGGVDFFGNGGQVLQVNLTQGIALGLHPDHSAAVFTDSSHGVQIYGTGQHPSALVVGVVTAYLCTSGSGKIACGNTAEGRVKTCIQAGADPGIQLENLRIHKSPPTYYICV